MCTDITPYRPINQREFLLNVLSHYPDAILNLTTDEHYGMIGHQGICECACIKFARDKTNSRKILEEKLLQIVQKRFGHSDELTIMSLGSEGCFQELVIHAKIVAKFNKKIHWVLVDPIYSKPGNKTLDVFYRLIKLLSPDSSVKFISDDQEAVKQMRKQADLRPDIFLSIDTRLANIFTAFTDDGMKSILDLFRESVSELSFPHMWAILEKGDPEFLL